MKMTVKRMLSLLLAVSLVAGMLLTVAADTTSSPVTYTVYSEAGKDITELVQIETKVTPKGGNRIVMPAGYTFKVDDKIDCDPVGDQWTWPTGTEIIVRELVEGSGVDTQKNHSADPKHENAIVKDPANVKVHFKLVLRCKNHVESGALVKNLVEATCHAEGSYDEVVECIHCGYVFHEEHKTIDKIEHTPAEAVIENNSAASCYAGGSYDEVVYCSVEDCKAEISRVTVPVGKVEHTPGEAVKENDVAPTCIAEGSYEEVVYCSVAGCGAELSRTVKPVSNEGVAHVDADENCLCDVEGCTYCFHEKFGEYCRNIDCEHEKTCECGGRDVTEGERVITVAVEDAEGNRMPNAPVQLVVNNRKTGTAADHSVLAEAVTDAYGKAVFANSVLDGVEKNYIIYANIAGEGYAWGWNEDESNVVREAIAGAHTSVVPGQAQGYLEVRNASNFTGYFKLLAKRTSATITFENWDGTVLQSGLVTYGEMPVYAGADPVKEGNAEFTYEFMGWDREIAAVDGDATYTAVFSEKTNAYLVTWMGADGVLETDDGVPYGEMPEYNGATPAKEDYIFVGWDREITPVTGDVTYTAQFKFHTRSVTIKTVDVSGNPVAGVDVQLYQNLNRNGGMNDHIALGKVTTGAEGVVTVSTTAENTNVDLRALTYGISIYASVDDAEYTFANVSPVRTAVAGINTAACKAGDGNGYIWMVAEEAEDGFTASLTLVVASVSGEDAPEIEEEVPAVPEVNEVYYNRKITVTVCDAYGNPVANAPVELWVNTRATGTIADHYALSATVYTDANGQAVFGDEVLVGVQRGQYVYANIAGGGYDYAWNATMDNTVREAYGYTGATAFGSGAGNQGYLNVTAVYGGKIEGSFVLYVTK